MPLRSRRSSGVWQASCAASAKSKTGEVPKGRTASVAGWRRPWLWRPCSSHCTHSVQAAVLS
eukprot:1903495-Alexandrium_andersonii.AAC.1